MTTGRLTEEQFFEFCQRNQQARFKRTAAGEVVLLTPTGGDTGWRNSLLTAQLVAHAKRAGGRAFDSSTGFVLPNGAMRSPDGAWVSEERWQALSEGQRRRFPPLCPDLVVELLSDPSDLADTREKMLEYQANGAGLGWLLDPFARRVEIYRPGTPPQTLEQPTQVEFLHLDGII